MTRCATPRYASPAGNGKALHAGPTRSHNSLCGLDVTLRLPVTHCARRPLAHEHVGVHDQPPPRDRGERRGCSWRHGTGGPSAFIPMRQSAGSNPRVPARLAAESRTAARWPEVHRAHARRRQGPTAWSSPARGATSWTPGAGASWQARSSQVVIVVTPAPHHTSGHQFARPARRRMSRQPPPAQ